jgi:Mrp family chromosome partitioning ATPase
MSRVYDVLTAPEHSVPSVEHDLTDDGAWTNEEEAPFIEIGGPGGPIFSNSSSKPIQSSSKPEPKPESPRHFPRLAAAPTQPAYLSVRFHDMMLAGLATPSRTLDLSLVTYHHPEHAISAEYRTLRNDIQKQQSSTNSRLLLFVASGPESGTTTVLLNLAITLARESSTRVLVVDLNTTRPAIASRLAIKSRPGLAEVLEHRVPLTLAIQPTVLPNLQALTCECGVSASIDRELPIVFNQLRLWYDWVLVDGGEAGTGSVSSPFSPSADSIYLVLREEALATTDLTGLQTALKAQGGLLRGYITTRL